jgi:hypothetical protein
VKAHLVAIVIPFVAACGGAPFTIAQEEAITDPEAGASTEASAPTVDAGEDAVAVPDSGSPTDHDGGVQEASSDAHVVADGAQEACQPVTHQNGIGNIWTDCEPIGTFNDVEAMDACRSNPGIATGNYCFDTEMCPGIRGVSQNTSEPTWVWIYSSSSTSVHAGDVLLLESSFTCQAWPARQGTWN